MPQRAVPESQGVPVIFHKHSRAAMDVFDKEARENPRSFALAPRHDNLHGAKHIVHYWDFAVVLQKALQAYESAKETP